MIKTKPLIYVIRNTENYDITVEIMRTQVRPLTLDNILR